MKKTIKITTLMIFMLLLLGITACQNDKPKPNDDKNIQEVIAKIDSLPDTTSITLDDEVKVGEARALYDALTDEEKGKVTNYSKLISLESKIKKLRDAQNIIDLKEMIDKLPEPNDVTINDKEQIEKAVALFESLSNIQKIQITNSKKLEAVQATLQTIIDEINRHKANAQVVINVIESLPTVENVQIKDKNDVENAMDIYNKLDQESKQYVTNYDKLVALQARIAELEETARLKDLASPIIKLINNLPSIDVISVDDSPAIEKIRQAYDKLEAAAKAYVTNYNTFVELEEKVEELKKQITDEKYTVTFYPNGGKIVDLVPSLDGTYYTAQYTGIATLPTPTKRDYIFLGWYKDSSFTMGAYTIASGEATYYAKWVLDQNKVLSYVSDIATSYTEDVLITNVDGAEYTWTSSNPDLYVIKDGIGKVSRAYQTHQTQQVTITVNAVYEDGTHETLSKVITVDPVLYESLPSTPVATYFSTSALYAYKQYNERYLKDGTLFSETTKETLDIIYYSFITINANGTCQLDNAMYVDEVLKLKDYNVRVVASVNGVNSTSCKYFMDITADSTKRRNFVKNLLDLVDRYHFDGLDIDWETVSDSIRVVASSLNLLVQELREEMTKRQAENGTPYFLSCAVPANSWGTVSSRFDFVTLDKYLDYINLMSYDMNKANVTTHLSPLYASSNDNGYGFGCVYGVERLVSLGFSRNKLIISSAGYGKAYRITGVSIGGTYPALGVTGTLTKISNVPGSFASGTLFGNGIQSIIEQGDYTEYHEYDANGQFVGSYLFNSKTGIFISFDSSLAIKQKYNYAKSIQGVGIMCWCYSEDTSDHVIDAIYQAKNN